VPRCDYRPEIDGLRALAVMAVLLYHAGFKPAHGGFVGVDIFFVISGFLITRLVLREIDAGSFTFRRFYARRVRRLGSALLFTCALVLLVGSLSLPPAHLLRLATSALHTLGSTANFHSWNDTGYFDAEAGFEPLLHTWSLGVEEQFYLVWPALLVAACSRLSRRALFVAMAALLGTSLWWCERMLDTDPSAAFFLTPFRVCELSLGGLAFALDERLRLNRAIREALAVVGLGSIGYAVFDYTASSRFPGLSALVPCCGTALVLLGGEARSAALLRLKPVTFIGEISYSLYLIHWPLIVFYRRLVTDDLAGIERLALCMASLAAATFMYKFIEQPFRRARPRAGSKPLSFATGIVAVLGLEAAFACSLWLTGGWPGRFPLALKSALDPALEASSRAFSWKALLARNRPFTTKDRLKLLVVGDSQAADFANLVESSSAKRTIDVATCPASKYCQVLFSPAPYADRTKVSRDCMAFGQKLARDTRIANADVVVLAFAWLPERLTYLPADISKLRALGARKVVVVGRKDQGESSIDTLARWRSFDGVEKAAATRKRSEAWQVNASLRSLDSDFVFLDLMSVLCPEPDRCYVVDQDRNPLLFDRRHFTEAGARFIATRLLALPQAAALFRLGAT